MSALTSLLARDHAVPVRKIEEALSRQVVSGGDIATVLLETDAIAENTLAAYQAALYSLLPATRDEVMRVQRDQIRLVPREVAEKHRLVPLAVDGRALLVAMAAPLDHDVESQLGFLLGYDLVVRIVCEVRISAALLHHYGLDAPTRQKRLIEQLRHRDAGTVPYVAPAEHGKLSLAQRGVVSKKISASAWLDEPDEPEPPPPPPPPRPSSMPPAPERRTTDPIGVPRSQVEAVILEAESTDPQLAAPPPDAPAPDATAPDATPPDATPPVAQTVAERDALIPNLVGASLSDLAVSEAWSSPPGTRDLEGRMTMPEASPPPPEADVEGRGTSPYGRAVVRPPTIDRAMPSMGALADAKSMPVSPRRSAGWQNVSRDDASREGKHAATRAAAVAAEPSGSTARTDQSVPVVKTGDRLSVAPIVGVGVRRSSRPPAGRPEPTSGDRVRPIVMPIVDSPPSEAPPPITTSRSPATAGIEVREPIATPASELPAAIEEAVANEEAHAARDRRSPRLRGPLTAAQAAKLLEDASDRDGIVAVFFAFARQFFDYAALFTLQDDRAEGRDAFGEGATAARIRVLSLTIAGDESSLFANARKSGVPQLGALSSPADLDLGTVIERPRGTFAIAYPVVIRARPVLILYGDRGGDRFELSDVPELVGFVRRVADALEKLILRRKRDGARGRFEKPKGEDRDDLKSSASAMRSSTRPPPSRPGSGPPVAASGSRGRPRREDVWSTPKLGAVVPVMPESDGPSLADALAKAELPPAARASLDPDPPSGAIPSPREADGSDLASRALDDATVDAPLRPVAERTTLVDLVPAAQVSAAPVELAQTTQEAPAANEAFRPTEEIARLPIDAPPASDTQGRRVARSKQTMRDVLGIPRAAPPPPVVGDIFEPPLEGDATNEVMLGSIDTLGSTEDAASLGIDGIDANDTIDGSDTNDEMVRGPTTIPVPPPDGADDSPELVLAEGQTDDEPELVVGGDADEGDEGDEGEGDDDEPAPIELRRRASPSYILRDAGVDVVEHVGARNSQPPRKRSIPPVASEEIGPTAGRRHDPRREDADPMAVEVVAKPQRGIGAMAKSAVIEGREQDGAKPTHDREVPSVIVDMGEATNALVEDLMHSDPDGDTPAVDALLKVGEVALPALAQAFPGPLWFDRRRPYRKLPRGRDVSAVSRALVAFRERAAPYVGALAGAGAHDRRFYAVMVASEIPSGALVDPLVQRVFDEDGGVRALVLEVLPKFRAFAEVQDQLVFLRRTARIRGKEPVRRLYALAALAALRDAGGLRTLVDLLEDEDANVRRGAHDALVAITCEDLGESARRWAAWSEKNEGRHRIEWLMDALLASDEALRSQAGEELKAITQQYFGYHPAASRKEREVVQTKYRHWWDREGRALFK